MTAFGGPAPELRTERLLPRRWREGDREPFIGFVGPAWTRSSPFTTPGNVRSRAVMERLGMTRVAADDFDHPSLPEGHRLRRHVLYRLRRDAWQAAARKPPGPRSRT